MGTRGSCSVESSKGSCLKISDIHILDRSQISVNKFTAKRCLESYFKVGYLCVTLLEKLLDLVGFSVASVVTGSQGGAHVSCLLFCEELQVKTSETQITEHLREYFLATFFKFR